MSHHRLATPELERIFQGETVSGLSEWQLLARYLEQRDELAFAALVARHGPMVMGTCRRMLSGGPDADDAFQATFMVLVRRARSLGPRDAIGPWLHGVATRISMRARAWQRGGAESSWPAASSACFDAATEPDAELAAIVNQELTRLPEKYRRRSCSVTCKGSHTKRQPASSNGRWEASKEDSPGARPVTRPLGASRHRAGSRASGVFDRSRNFRGA